MGWPDVHVTFPALPAADLVAFLAEEFGSLPSPPASSSESLRQLRGHLAATVAQGRRPLLVVDEAHLIDQPSTFDALRLLLNFATDGSPDLSLLFVGGAEVLLDLPSGLADRLAARCLLAPLTESEASRLRSRPPCGRRSTDPPSSLPPPCPLSTAPATASLAALTALLTWLYSSRTPRISHSPMTDDRHRRPRIPS